jgi:hypothetical protein
VGILFNLEIRCFVGDGRTPDLGERHEEQLTVGHFDAGQRQVVGFCYVFGVDVGVKGRL